jgi:sugar phosphate isomerase/epimerase
MTNPIHSLSTMWSQGRFPRDGHAHDHMPSFAEKAAELGFPHIEINYVIPPAGVEALLASNHVAVSSVHSPCPRVKAPDGRMSDALNLASDDEEERRLAVSYAHAAVDVARRADAKLIVVHLGGVGSAIFDEEKQLRRLYDEGTRAGDHVDGLRRNAAERRRDGHSRYYPNARKSLAEIAEHASKFGVAIGLENRYHFHEFPNTDETHELLSEYPADIAGFWLDVGHAEVLERLGLAAGKRWLNELAGRCIGTHGHDVDGLADHRAPGHGTADWDHFSAMLPPQIPRIFEINQRIDEERVAASIPFLRERGVLPRV